MTASQLIKSLKSKKNKDLDIYQLSDGSPTEVRQWVSTGLRKFDMIISNKMEGGFPVGKLTTLVGEQGSGKTLLAMMAAKDVIKKNGLVIWIDTENSLDLTFLESFGIPRDKLVYIQLNTVEAMFETLENIAKDIRENNTDQLVLMVVDSIAGLSTKAEVEGAVGDANFGIAARLLSQGLRKHIIDFGKMRVCLLFTNQLRFNMKAAMFEDPLSAMYGGKAIPYYSSLLIKLSKSSKLKDEDKEIVGNQVLAKVIKNRLAPPFRSTYFECVYESGVSEISQILDELKKMEIIKVGGAKYTWTAGPVKDSSFAKKDWVKLFNEPAINKFIFETLASKYILDIDRYVDADGVSARAQIVSEDQK